MGVVGLLTRGLQTVRPVARAAKMAAKADGELAVVPGEPAATRRLKELLGEGLTSMPSEDAMLVMAAAPGADLEVGAEALARRRRRGGDVLAIVVGTAAERAELERTLLRDNRLEPSNLVHLRSLEGEGSEDAVDSIVRALGFEAVAAGRQNAALRPAVARKLVRDASRRSAALSALPLSGADMPVLAITQVILVGQLAALHGRPMGPERGLEAAAVFGAGFGWRAVARAARAALPLPPWAVRAGVAYAGTRLTGEAARARLAAGHDLIEGAPVDAAKPHLEKVLDKLPGVTKGTTS